MDNFTN